MLPEFLAVTPEQADYLFKDIQKITGGNMEKWSTMTIDNVPVRIEVKDFSEVIEKKIIEFACAAGISIECARRCILQGMREHSPEEKARYKKELGEKR